MIGPPTTVYHAPTKSAIVCPPYCPELVGDITYELGSVVNWYLLLLHPKDYVKTMWMELTRGRMDLKQFVLQTMQIPQTNYLSNPDHTIRSEWAVDDLKGVGIEGVFISPYSPPGKEMCMSTSAAVRRMYKMDYELGDYD